MSRHRNSSDGSWGWWLIAAVVVGFGIWVYYTLESNGLLK